MILELKRDDAWCHRKPNTTQISTVQNCSKEGLMYLSIFPRKYLRIEMEHVIPPFGRIPLAINSFSSRSDMVARQRWMVAMVTLDGVLGAVRLGTAAT